MYCKVLNCRFIGFATTASYQPVVAPFLSHDWGKKMNPPTHVRPWLVDLDHAGSNPRLKIAIDKAAELDSSARIWLCTPQETSTEALTFLAKNHSCPMPCQWESSRRPHSRNQFCACRSVVNKPNPNIQWLAQQWSQGWKPTKQEQVWHQVKNTAAGSELMASSEADKIGASVAPGENHNSRVTFVEQMC